MENFPIYENCSKFNRYLKNVLTVRVVIPTLNEEKNLNSLLIELKTLGYFDVIVIDGNSIDRTVEVAKMHGAKVILQNGHGKGDAIRQVLKNNCNDVDAVVMMDADGSMDAKEIPFFIRKLKSGVDLVKGSRFLKGGYTHDMTLLRRIGNTLMVSIFNMLFLTKHSDLCYGFIAFNRRSVRLLPSHLKSQNFEIETEILVKAKKLGLKVSEVPSTEFKRKNGTSNLNTFTDGLKIFKTIFQNSITQ